MPRKVIPAGVVRLGRHRRPVLVAAFPVVLAGIALAVAGGSGGGTSGKASSGGIVRASSAGTASSSLVSGTQNASFGPNVGTGIYQGVSPAVSSLPELPVKTPTSITPRDIEALKPVGSESNVKDPVVQSKKGSGPISGPVQNFDGACLPFGPPCEQPSGCSCLPPDTNGEVGATQYVQMVNTDFTVFSKTGAALRGATPVNQLWANTDGECKTHNDGDPVVVYDQLAKRWLLSQFIVAGADEQYGECIAVSTTSDATGSYYLYEFRFGDISPATFHD